MYMSELVGKTLKKIDDEFYLPSQRLLIRAGMFRSLDAGVFTTLPLGVKVLEKLERLITKKMEDFGYQRVYISNNGEFIKNLGISIRNEIKSYKELPTFLYDIHTIGRDNIKVKAGLLGAKEYRELRGCSFHRDIDDLHEIYNSYIEFYTGLFRELGLEVLNLNSFNPKSNNFDGHDFIVKANWGDKVLYRCEGCNYTSLEDAASFMIDEITNKEDLKIEYVHTPDIKTISELEDYLGIEGKELAKTLLVKVKDEIIAVVLRGDRDLNLHKLSRVLKVNVEEIKIAEEGDIEHLKTVAGFVGPVGLEKIKIITDREVYEGGYFIVGANKRDYHLKNVLSKRDYNSHIVDDISSIREDDKCPYCGSGFKKEYGVKIGGLYNLGKNIGVKNFNFKDREGKVQEIYGIYKYFDLYRLLSAIVEKNHDEEGIVWPVKIAPYHIIISVLNTKNEEKLEFGKEIYDELKNTNFEVLLDDRNERAGVKFKDADLLGIPIRIVVGKRAGERIVEYKLRWEDKKEELKIYEALGKAMKYLKSKGLT